jgi:hypothetical protein
MKRFVFSAASAVVLGLVAAGQLAGATSAAAAWCENMPPNKKITCCLNHPKAPACR